MAEALSTDLRKRVVEAVNGGMSRRQAAEHFKVGVSSAIRWVALATGDVKPKRQGGDRRSAAIEAQADFILSLLGPGGDDTLAEMRAALAAKGHSFRISALSRFFARRCESARGPRVDRRAKPLAELDRAGSINGAVSQSRPTQSRKNCRLKCVTIDPNERGRPPTGAWPASCAKPSKSRATFADLHLWRLGPGHLGAIVSVITMQPREASYYKSRLARFTSLSVSDQAAAACPLSVR
jgi:transposase